jgi:hypothetical protein
MGVFFEKKLSGRIVGPGGMWNRGFYAGTLRVAGVGGRAFGKGAKVDPSPSQQKEQSAPDASADKKGIHGFLV